MFTLLVYLPRSKYYNLLFASHYLSQTTAYVCQKLLLHLVKAFEKYKQNYALASFFDVTMWALQVVSHFCSTTRCSSKLGRGSC